MANGFTTDIAGAVNRGLQFRQAEQLRPGQLQQQQFGLQQQEQNLAIGQQGIETEQQRTKSQNLFNTVARLRSLPDSEKLSFVQQNIRDVESRGGDPAESRQAEALIQQGNFQELNEGLDNLFTTGVQTGFLKSGPQAEGGFTLSPGQQRFAAGGGQPIAEVSAPDKRLSPLQQKVSAEGIDPNSPAGFARAKVLNQRAATDPSLKRSDQQILNKANEGQLASAGFANRVNAANENIIRLEQVAGFDPTSIQAAFFQAIPGGNIALSTEQQQYAQAKSDFITAVLRKESGAAIGVDEFDKEDKKFFPQVGDKPEVLKQKAAGRKRAFDNLRKQSKGVFRVQFENPAVFTGNIADISDEDLKKSLGL